MYQAMRKEIDIVGESFYLDDQSRSEQAGYIFNRLRAGVRPLCPVANGSQDDPVCPLAISYGGLLVLWWPSGIMVDKYQTDNETVFEFAILAFLLDIRGEE